MDPNENRYTLMNNEAHQLMSKGRKDKAIVLFSDASMNGQPNAFASLTWHLALNERFKESINIFEKFFKFTDKWISEEIKRIGSSKSIGKDVVRHYADFYYYQQSNTKSNAAISYLATGDEKTALKLWEEAADNHGHREAKFYPILHAGKKDINFVRPAVKNSFTLEEIQGLIKDMQDVIRDGKGWFSNWAAEGLQILQQASKGKKYSNSNQGIAAATGTAAAVTGFTGGNYIAAKMGQEYLQNDIQESGGFFEWIEDLFS